MSGMRGRPAQRASHSSTRRWFSPAMQRAGGDAAPASRPTRTSPAPYRALSRACVLALVSPALAGPPDAIASPPPSPIRRSTGPCDEPQAVIREGPVPRPWLAAAAVETSRGWWAPLPWACDSTPGRAGSRSGRPAADRARLSSSACLSLRYPGGLGFCLAKAPTRRRPQAWSWPRAACA